MPQNEFNSPRYVFKPSVLTGACLKFLRFFDGLFKFFSLRASEQFWGIIYDSVTKQPLDPVVVKLLYADGREAETCVTDIGGRYGFLARPGKFKIFARKTNYNFPSKNAAGSQDGIFENLYHGEFFELTGGAEIIAPNIPMDPLGFDWNQQAKKQLVNTYPFFGMLVKRLAAVIFWFGFILLGLRIWESLPYVSFFWLGLGAACLVFLGLAVILPEVRLWGRLKILGGAGNPEGLRLELRNPQFPKVSFGRTVVEESGKFLLRASPGKYLLQISKISEQKEAEVLGVIKVKIGGLGVLNSTILMRRR